MTWVLKVQKNGKIYRLSAYKLSEPFGIYQESKNNKFGYKEYKYDRGEIGSGTWHFDTFNGN